MASLMNSTKHYRKLTPILFKFFQNITQKRILPNSFYETIMH